MHAIVLSHRLVVLEGWRPIPRVRGHIRPCLYEKLRRAKVEADAGVGDILILGGLSNMLGKIRLRGVLVIDWRGQEFGHVGSMVESFVRRCGIRLA